MYIDAENLRATIEKIINSIESCPFIEAEFGAEEKREGKILAYNKILALIDSLQQEQPKKYIELNGIKYREVPAKTNDKICKDCDYFLDNGTCELVDCPCIDDNTILERLNEQLDVDLEKDVESWFFNEISSKINVENTMYYYFQECARRFYELGLNARKEE